MRHREYWKGEKMGETPHMSEALGRLMAAFRGTIGVELTDTDLAELAGLDDGEAAQLSDRLRAHRVPGRRAAPERAGR